MHASPQANMKNISSTEQKAPRGKQEPEREQKAKQDCGQRSDIALVEIAQGSCIRVQETKRFPREKPKSQNMDYS